ncbi:RNA helicase [Elizabethkingia anophelis]|uniref:RNA helicase n=1 Tax=Elizabethkingia anophelis TaxID=1117645 RepID=UPI0021A7AED8|nr:RNA helicase [Elizabethkingia anophelis]MCT4221188.1 RNA helicase [Elizabethkingia anophelis]MDV2444944.1 RNA helicase [Elizabethkingia anophelis]MDV3927667.1 RNA helicase [Elizabethkingia anophelis]MDV4023747.1 RNA helicase [Elizabethkingia anophelis]
MDILKEEKKKNSEVANIKEVEIQQQKDNRPVCGLIMPIADTEGYPIGHWKEVKKIITAVAEEAGFKTRLVSESDDVRVIQKTIVQNVFDDDIVICDVSSKNPNVMFELGLRFAFDKAAVIIKDDETGYSFDTSPIEHINYRKDLRFSSIEQFKKDLYIKLCATFEKSKEDNHSMYLQNFGKFVVKELNTKEVTENRYIFEKLDELQKAIKNISVKDEVIIKKEEFSSVKEIVEALFYKYTNGEKDYAKSGYSRNKLAQLISATLEESYHLFISDRTVSKYISEFISK